jgi:hypothetical protein
MARLEGKCTVTAINDAVYLAWWADHLHSCDFKWWNWHIQRVQHFAGRKTTLDATLPPAWGVERLESTGREGYDPAPGKIRSGSDGGYQALHIAAQDGARRVILLGYDMQPGAQTHWFGDHPDEVRCDLHGLALRWYPGLKAELDRLGVEVVNCSPGSALSLWPFRQIDAEIFGSHG